MYVQETVFSCGHRTAELVAFRPSQAKKLKGGVCSECKLRANRSGRSSRFARKRPLKA